MEIKLLLVFLFLIILIYLTQDNLNEKFENTNETLDLKTEYDRIFSLEKTIEKVHDILNNNKIEYWINGGTLLGAVRDKGHIQDYANISIMKNSENKLIEMKKVLKDNNLGLSGWFGGYRIYNLNGTPIENKKFKYPFVDVFVCDEIDGKIMFVSKIARKMWSNEYFNPKELFPLKLYDFSKFKLYGPNEPNYHLDRLYPNWKDDANINATNNYFKFRCFDRINFKPIFNKSKKPYLWQYWDTIDGKEVPPYIRLSMKTVDIHCSKSFNIIRLNKDNIMNYIPEIERFKDILEPLIIAHKVDIYRIMLLYKYGGIYMDADIICLRDPIEVADKLNKYDFVGFGCTGGVCKYGYGMPSNWILASRPNGILMGRVLNNVINKITTQKKFDYHDIGKNLIWEELDKLIKNEKYEYFHYPNTVDGTRDKDGYWIDSELVFSNTPIEYDDEENMLFYVYYNSGINADFKKLSEEELLAKDWNFTKFLKKGLGLK